jgi:hypothetical protein
MGWDKGSTQIVSWIGLLQFANVQPGYTVTRYCEHLSHILPLQANETTAALAKKLEALHGTLVEDLAALLSPPPPRK